MQTLQLFPALAGEPAKLRNILDTGRNGHGCRARKRRLPWHLSFHDQPQSKAPPAMPSGTQSECSITGSLCPGSLRGGSSIGAGCGRSCASLSTTSKKTMESLCSSVYEELQPFRRAHRTLIKNRMAVKSANDMLRTSPSFSRFSQSASADGNNSIDSSSTSVVGRHKKRKKQSALESGLAKVTLCASSFAWMYGKRCIKGFQRRRMTPAVFREQLQMALHIYLRPAEGAAVADFFDVERVGSVNGEHFVRWFLQAGLDSREERLRAQAAEDQEEQRLRREMHREEEARQRDSNKAAVEADFSPEDRKAALLLLGKVALSYHDQRTGHEAAQRDFACALGPVNFRVQLFRSFGIRLTDRQFAALFDVIDINRDRCIDGAEFLRFFFGLGNRERAKEQRQHEVNCRARARNLRLDKLPPISPILGR